MTDAEIIKMLSHKPTYNLLCSVLSVDESAQVCDVSPINGDADLLDVRLKANLKANAGILIVPKKDSHVIISMLEDNECYISQYSEVEKVIIKIDGTTIIYDKNGTKISNGTAEIELTSDNISLKKGVSHVKVSDSGTAISKAGVSLASQISQLITQIAAITVTVPTPGGPVIVPINNALAFPIIQQTINQIIV